MSAPEMHLHGAASVRVGLTKFGPEDSPLPCSAFGVTAFTFLDADGGALFVIKVFGGDAETIADVKATPIEIHPSAKQEAA